MRDLLTDISDPSSASDNNYDIFQTLNNLEKELDGNAPHTGGGASIQNTTTTTNTTASATTTTLRSPLPPGLNASAAALVVDHASMVPPPHNNPSNAASGSKSAGGGGDAWSHALNQFSALSLTDDFLKADSDRKQHQNQQQEQIINKVEEVSNNVVDSLFDGEEEEYDVMTEAVLGDTTSKDMMNLFPGIQQQAHVSTKSQSETKEQPESCPPPPTPSAKMIGQGGTPLQSPPPPDMHPHHPPPPNMHPHHPHPSHMHPHHPPPSHMPPHMIGAGPPPPHMNMHPHPYPHPPHIPPHMMGAGPPPPHMNMHPHQHPHLSHMPPHMMGAGPPPPGALPQHHQAAMIHHMQQQMMQQQNNPNPNNMNLQNTSQPATAAPSTIEVKKEQKTVFKKLDFPALGVKQSEIEKLRKEEETKELEDTRKKKKEMRSNHKNAANSVRLSFQDPSPNAPSVPATAIKCNSMSSRDLCHVLHSMMRPLLTFENVLDAYNADYYRWSYDDRKSRNLLFNNNGPGNKNLPNPVWKETKIKAQAMEDKFRDTVEKRADEWSKEKQALGRMTKVNVKRPRALLATNSLSVNAESRMASGVVNEEENEEDKQRAFLWAARVAIDKGYLAYLNLVELRRLLQSRPGDALGSDNQVENRKEELLHDVEENVIKLHSAFGVTKVNSILEVNETVLSRTLTLPKGRMLLSRVIDEGVLPHPSACRLLSVAIKIIFLSVSNADLSVAPPAGEDRLLRSLTGLVQTVRPSVDAANLLTCLTSVIDAKKVMVEKKKSMKTVLAGKRTLMELLHAVFTRGGEVCVGEYEVEWKTKESSFLSILSEA